MREKLTDLREAVARNIKDGDVVFVGGFGQCVPFAIAHEIARQGKKDLTLCRTGADTLFDLLIAAGCVRKVVFGYVGNPGIGLAHAFRRAVQAGTLEVEDWTNFSMVLRLHAGALGVPFLPTAAFADGDLKSHIDVRDITCPFTGEKLTAVPALTPDVAIMHAQAADREGNVQLFGLPGDTLDGVRASKRVIATVEEIVPPETVRSRPDRTVVAGFQIAAVSQVPWGAYPSYVDGVYGRDDQAYAEWDKFSRSAEELDKWIATEVRRRKDFADYVAHLDPDRLEKLTHSMGGRRDGR